jgi:hypothetical protein
VTTVVGVELEVDSSFAKDDDVADFAHEFGRGDGAITRACEA